MRDNPIHLAVFGPDPERRQKALRGMFTGLFTVIGTQAPLGARDASGALVGVTGVAPPGTCRPSPIQRLRLLPHLLARGPYTTGRVLGWLGVWGRHDPGEPHSHLGPFAVEPELQGNGIGTRILEEYTRRLDAAGEVGYLETDKEVNVTLYRRHGFEVVSEEEVLGVPCWFMERAAEAVAGNP